MHVELRRLGGSSLTFRSLELLELPFNSKLFGSCARALFSTSIA